MAYLFLVKRRHVSVETKKAKSKRMKKLPLFAASTVLISIVLPLTAGYGQDPDWKPPGTEETAAVEQANAQIDAVYKQLMSKLDTEGQKSLKDAQRSWIKWRDSEALLMARIGGAVGGSALRMDYLNAQIKLIHQRTEALKAYLTASGSN